MEHSYFPRVLSCLCFVGGTIKFVGQRSKTYCASTENGNVPAASRMRPERGTSTAWVSEYTKGWCVLKLLCTHTIMLSIHKSVGVSPTVLLVCRSNITMTSTFWDCDIDKLHMYNNSIQAHWPCPTATIHSSHFVIELMGPPFKAKLRIPFAHVQLLNSCSIFPRSLLRYPFYGNMLPY